MCERDPCNYSLYFTDALYLAFDWICESHRTVGFRPDFGKTNTLYCKYCIIILLLSYLLRRISLFFKTINNQVHDFYRCPCIFIVCVTYDFAYRCTIRETEKELFDTQQSAGTMIRARELEIMNCSSVITSLSEEMTAVLSVLNKRAGIKVSAC